MDQRAKTADPDEHQATSAHPDPGNEPIAFNADWLLRLGLGALTPADANDFLRCAYEVTSARAGERLMREVSADEAIALDALIQAGDEAGAKHFIDVHIPNYRQIVRSVITELEDEIREAAPQILALAAATAGEGEHR